MNNLEEYVEKMGCTKKVSQANEALIATAEARLGVTFGPQLREYFLKYGGLCYESEEFFSLSTKESINSSVISETETAKGEGARLDGFVVIYHIENWGYALVDSEDNIYEQAYACSDPPVPTGKELNEYIKCVFDEERTRRKEFMERSALEDYVKAHISLPPDSERAAESVLCRAKKILGMEYNFDVECYLREYGLISYGNIRLCGLLKALGDYPNIVVETIKMRQKYPQTENLVTTEVLENEKYVVTDDDGEILIFDGEKGEAYPTHKSFSKYYLERFEEEQKRMGK